MHSNSEGEGSCDSKSTPKLNRPMLIVESEDNASHSTCDTLKYADSFQDGDINVSRLHIQILTLLVRSANILTPFCWSFSNKSPVAGTKQRNKQITRIVTYGLSGTMYNQVKFLTCKEP